MDTIYQRFINAITKAEIDQLFADGYDLTTHISTIHEPSQPDKSIRIVPILYACANDKLEVVKALAEHGVNLHGFYYSNKIAGKPIGIAARYGNIKIVEYLVNAGCKIDDAVCEATENNHIDVLEYLLSLGIDNNNNLLDLCNYKPLEIACRSGNRKALDLLLKAGSPVNLGNSTHPLIRVAYDLEDNFARQFTEQLVIYGADVNHTDYMSQTPLYVACENNKVELVDFLTSLRCEVNTVHYMIHETPLIIACHLNNIEIVKLLLSTGANIKYVDRFGKQAIDYTGSEEIRNLLSS